MSGWTKARDTILQTQVGATGIRALVVEGEDDREFFEALLDKVAPGNWQTRWCVGVADGKENVLRILDDQPNWLGVVDRDEWSDNAANAAVSAVSRFGRLHVLPRFCMESYFIHPMELWAALPPQQQNRISGGADALEAAVLANLTQWTRHGALWHAVNPLWSGLRGLGFKEKLLDFHNAQNQDEIIRATLTEWHSFLNPDRVMAEFHANLRSANGVADEERLNRWVHGKQFFNRQLAPTLNRLLGQQSTDRWLTLLANHLQPPRDLQFLWNAMGFA